jgi:hypothetical protein
MSPHDQNPSYRPGLPSLVAPHLWYNRTSLLRGHQRTELGVNGKMSVIYFPITPNTPHQNISQQHDRYSHHLPESTTVLNRQDEQLEQFTFQPSFQK